MNKSDEPATESKLGERTTAGRRPSQPGLVPQGDRHYVATSSVMAGITMAGIGVKPQMTDSTAKMRGLSAVVVPSQSIANFGLPSLESLAAQPPTRAPPRPTSSGSSSIGRYSEPTRGTTHVVESVPRLSLGAQEGPCPPAPLTSQASIVRHATTALQDATQRGDVSSTHQQAALLISAANNFIAVAQQSARESDDEKYRAELESRIRDVEQDIPRLRDGAWGTTGEVGEPSLESGLELFSIVNLLSSKLTRLGTYIRPVPRQQSQVQAGGFTTSNKPLMSSKLAHQVVNDDSLSPETSTLDVVVGDSYEELPVPVVPLQYRGDAKPPGAKSTSQPQSIPRVAAPSAGPPSVGVAALTDRSAARLHVPNAEQRPPSFTDRDSYGPKKQKPQARPQGSSSSQANVDEAREKQPSLANTDVGAVGKVTDAQRAPVIPAGSIGKIESANVERAPSASVARLASASGGKVDVLSSGQVKPASIGKVDPATIGKVEASSIGKVDPASIGKVNPTSMGKVNPASIGKVEASSIGKVDPVSIWKVDPVSIGKVNPASIGKVNSASVGKLVGPSPVPLVPTTAALSAAAIAPPPAGRSSGVQPAVETASGVSPSSIGNAAVPPVAAAPPSTNIVVVAPRQPIPPIVSAPTVDPYAALSIGKVAAPPPSAGPVFHVNWNPSTGLQGVTQVADSPARDAIIVMPNAGASNLVAPAPFVLPTPIAAPPSLRALEFAPQRPLEVNVNVAGLQTGLTADEKSGMTDRKGKGRASMLRVERTELPPSGGGDPGPSSEAAAAGIDGDGPSVEVYEVYETRRKLRFFPWISWKIDPNKAERKKKRKPGYDHCESGAGRAVCGQLFRGGSSEWNNDYNVFDFVDSFLNRPDHDNDNSIARSDDYQQLHHCELHNACSQPAEYHVDNRNLDNDYAVKHHDDSCKLDHYHSAEPNDDDRKLYYHYAAEYDDDNCKLNYDYRAGHNDHSNHYHDFDNYDHDNSFYGFHNHDTSFHDHDAGVHDYNGSFNNGHYDAIKYYHHYNRCFRHHHDNDNAWDHYDDTEYYNH
ncbi:hypothetical protein HDU87_006416 [Geranomyces variabilis]|uniref:Uncharacterized protein n=1 Tax=Geranomyces variabilis TaxID=109894 RepID=A0AAD5TFI5_9FUNG|nr:hypothetical protein HDU87_006416 [Geranomyces variabilis]